MNLLFIGNSFTYYNNLPSLVADIAVADGQSKPNVYSQTIGGGTLGDNLNKIAADGSNNVIDHSLPAGQRWGDVILQDLSTRPTNVSGPPINGNPGQFQADAAGLFSHVRSNSPAAKAVLYETWARGALNPFYPQSFAGPSVMQSQLLANYTSAQNSLNNSFGAGSTSLAPVGEAWRSLNWDRGLYSGDDEYHPSGEGSMLASLVLFSTIYHVSASSIPASAISSDLNSLGLSSADWQLLTHLADVQTSGAVQPAPVYQVDAGGGAAGAFAADSGFNGGVTYGSGAQIDTSGLATAAPQQVYQTERYGNFSYTASNLTPGTVYSVRLDFAELYWNASGQRVFNVAINGNQVLSNFDVFAAAGGQDKAVARTFSATADGNGRISVSFNTLKDNAKLSGITIAPLVPQAVAQAPTVATAAYADAPAAGSLSTVLHVLGSDAGGESNLKYTWSVVSGPGSVYFYDSNSNSAKNVTANFGAYGTYTLLATITNSAGQTTTSTTNVTLTNSSAALPILIHAGGPAVGSFAADNHFVGGSTYRTGNAIDTSGVSGPNVPPQSLYQTERYGNFSYVIPSLVPGSKVIVRLHFAEIFWNAPGQRVFNVIANGVTQLSNYDIFKAAGGKNKAVAASFVSIVDNTGKLVLAFNTIIDNAKLDGIEITPAS